MDKPESTVPYGYCHCGCGKKTALSRRTWAAQGLVRGEPRRYVSGHNRRSTATTAERFWARVDKSGPGGCWEWLGGLDAKGYGKFLVRTEGGRVRKRAHRVAYNLLVGPVPEGLQLDHLCRNRKCVNPAHLEAVTSAENTRRGRRAKLTSEQAAAIRESQESATVLADRYGVSDTCVRLVRQGKTWVTA